MDGRGGRVHQDLIADCGSLGGLYTGLHYARHDRIFVVACDMPFIASDMVRFFVSRDPYADIVMGRLPEGLQPLHAVYGKRALPVFERMARAKRLRIQNIVSEPSLSVVVLDPVEWAGIDPSSQSFQNLNTPADLEAARAFASRNPIVK